MLIQWFVNLLINLYIINFKCINNNTMLHYTLLDRITISIYFNNNNM